MTVLYRKYRPQSFKDVAGQEHVKTVLSREIAAGRLAHSYLFTGPRGVGKTTIARIFAKAVNCPARTEGQGEPCGACDSCGEVTAGRSLDVIEIDAASHTGVDNVREQIIENARFAPAKSRYKVFIIDEAHMLSNSAFNALLKTLEEPPAHVLFVLATTELHKLPATVVSRCQRFDFRKIGREDLLARLERLAGEEGLQVDPEVLHAVARHSEGCLRDAESLFSQIIALGAKKIDLETAALVLPALSAESVLDLAAALVERDAQGALRSWSALAAAGADLNRVVGEVTEIIRGIAVARLKGEVYEPLFAPDAAGRDRLVALQARLAPPAASSLLKRLVAVRDEMRRAELIELPFEMMAMEWSAETSAASGQRSGASHDDDPPAAPRVPVTETAATRPEAPPEGPTLKESASLSEIRGAWTEILRRAQEKNHALPYMLGVAELLSCEDGELTIGFQYALYRDRLNDMKYKPTLEAAIRETVGKAIRIKPILAAQRVDGTVEAAPSITVSPAANLPDGFAELVKEFGGTVA